MIVFVVLCAAAVGLALVVAYQGGVEQGWRDGWAGHELWLQAQAHARGRAELLHPSRPAPDVDELEAMWRRPPPPYDWQKEDSA